MSRSEPFLPRLLFVAVALATALSVPACGGTEPRMSEAQKQSIRQNADNADRDLERESSKSEQ